MSPVAHGSEAALERLFGWSAPRWLEELIDRYNAGVANQFVLHGNVDDVYPVGDQYYRMPELLGELTRRRDIVLFANVSTGISVRRGDVRFLEYAMGRPPGFSPDLQETASDRIRKLPRDPNAMLEAIDRALRASAPGAREIAVVFDYASSIIPAGDGRAPGRSEKSAAITLHRWGNDRDIAERNPIIFLVERRQGDLNADAFDGNGGVVSIELPLPDEEARQAFVEHFGRTHAPAMVAGSPRGLRAADVARLSGGLALVQLEDLLLETWGRGMPVSEGEILDRKIEILHRAYGDILEVVRPRFGLDAVGGLEHVKGYLAEVAELMRSGLRKHVPMGILIMGPPGTGKTFVIECFAKACGLLVVKAKSLRAKYVGESERNQERFFSVIAALAPVVVIIDESEQEQGSRDPDRQDHPVDARMRARGFQFWGNSANRGSILRIDITNWPRLMDPAMLRSGRTDTKIPILYPDVTARSAILRVQCKRHKLPIDGVDFDDLAARTEGYSPADLEQIVLLADRLASVEATQRGPDSPAAVTMEHFSAALDDFLLPRRDRGQIDRMSLQALEECSRRSLMPEGADALLQQLRERLGDRS